MAIGIHELAAISERRIERLCNPSLSELPAFLVAEGGLNSGFMIAHCTAAALGKDSTLCQNTSPAPEGLSRFPQSISLCLGMSSAVALLSCASYHAYLAQQTG